MSYQLPEGGAECVTLSHNYTLEVGILSNPPPIVTSQSWSFVDYNGTLHDNLPDNVNVSVHPGKDRLTIISTLIVTDAQYINYGNYTLMAGNNYGSMTPVILSVLSEGAFDVPAHALYYSKCLFVIINLLYCKM